MALIGWYTLFALATSFTFLYEIFFPVIRELEECRPEHNIVENKIISIVTFMLMAILLAPIVLPACLIPSWGERFRFALLDSLKQP
jgi:hypothetical protein